MVRHAECLLQMVLAFALKALTDQHTKQYEMADNMSVVYQTVPLYAKL